MQRCLLIHPVHAGIPCVSGELVGELSRGVRMHFSHYVKQLEEHNLRDAQRGLAHSYSRAKVKFNVNRVDNMIIQVIHVTFTHHMQFGSSCTVHRLAISLLIQPKRTVCVQQRDFLCIHSWGSDCQLTQEPG